MSPQMKTRAGIAMLVYVLANAVLFGAGLIVVLIAAGSALGTWIPTVVALSVLLAAPIAWEIAPRSRAHNRPHMELQPLTLRVQHYRRHPR